MNKLTKTLLVIVLLLALIVGGMIAMILLRGEASNWQEQYEMGMRFLLDGKYEQAILAFNAALEIEPNRAEIYLARGEAYTHLGDWEAAQRDYSTAAELDPDLEQEAMRRLEELAAQRQTDPEGETALSGTIAQTEAITEETATEQPQDEQLSTEADTEHLSFSEIPGRYILSSGAGAWMTELELTGDGSFAGDFHDSNAGENGPGYRGTVYRCRFTGQFTQPVKVNDYMYRMELRNLDLITPEGDTYIEDEVRYITSTPYGMEEDTVYYLYLPGTPRGVMPEYVYDWVSLLYGYGDGMDRVYVIAGEKGQLPFMGEME